MTTATHLSLVDHSDMRDFVDAVSSGLGTEQQRKDFVGRFQRNSFEALADIFQALDVGKVIPFFEVVDDQSRFDQLLAAVPDRAATALRLLRDAWSVFQRMEPDLAREFKTKFDSNPYSRMDDIFYRRVNDVIECYGRVTLDGEPSLRYQGVLRLGNPNKQLGRENELFMTCSVPGLIYTAILMINSLRFHIKEQKVCLTGLNDAMKRELAEAFDALGEAVTETRQEYLASK